ncbi:MAG: aminoglycoside 3-N-acetyltransferase [Candidatus Latescibacterota bacterium]
MLTRSAAARDLRRLGVAPGAVVMVHASMRAVGPVVGGPDVLILALLDALGPAGTVMMYVGWEHQPDDVIAPTPEHRQAYLDELPPFDPATSRARRGHGILAEYLRTWPGARRSSHPEASVAAVGARAEWITGQHPLVYGYGERSPLGRLVEARGQVLMVGAPLNTVTLLHHAEHLARLPDKRHERFRMPVLRDGERVWVDVVQFDTSNGVVSAPYTLEQIAGDYVAAGRGRAGTVGSARSHLFDAADLVAFAVAWLESRFGSSAS